MWKQVAELSEPSLPELRETIHSVVHGLLATLSPRMHSKGPPSSEYSSDEEVCSGNDDYPELVENVSLQFQPIVSLTRDYLARLLFWLVQLLFIFSIALYWVLVNRRCLIACLIMGA